MKIDFGENAKRYGSGEEYIEWSADLLADPERYKETLTNPICGVRGVVCIEYEEQKFQISHESVHRQMRMHTDAIEAILDYKPFKWIFFDQLGNFRVILSEYVDTHIMLREIRPKYYYVDKEEEIYFGEYKHRVNQEIILPKIEYMEAMLSCIDRYLQFQYINRSAERPITKKETEEWQKKIEEFQQRVEKLKNIG